GDDAALPELRQYRRECSGGNVLEGMFWRECSGGNVRLTAATSRHAYAGAAPYVVCMPVSTIPAARYRSDRLESRQATIGLRTPIAIELPYVAHFANLIEIELRGDQLGGVARRLRHEFSAR